MPSALQLVAEGRDFSVRHVAQFFDYEHLPPDLQAVSQQFHDLAVGLLGAVPDNPELTVALRKLLESKDAAVRATVAARSAGSGLDVVRCPVNGTHPGHRWHDTNPHGSLFQIIPPDAKLVWCRGEAKQ